MASSFSFAHLGNNCSMAYSNAGSSYSAQVRVKTFSYNYGTSSTEDHARNNRAFYPHRRTQGQFSLTVECKGYKEFNQLMSWLRAYSDSLLSAQIGPGSSLPIIDVSVPSRNFRRIGFINSGISDHDQVGSMVFAPELVFVALKDPSDAAIPLLTMSDISQFSSPQSDSNNSIDFYPVSSASYKDSSIYDTSGDPYANVAATVAPPQTTDPVFNAAGKGGEKFT